MNAEQFIEENYFGLKIDCPRDIQTIYQALEAYAKALQSLQPDVSKCACDNVDSIKPYYDMDNNIFRCDKCDKHFF